MPWLGRPVPASRKPLNLPLLRGLSASFSASLKMACLLFCFAKSQVRVPCWGRAFRSGRWSNSFNYFRFISFFIALFSSRSSLSHVRAAPLFFLSLSLFVSARCYGACSRFSFVRRSVGLSLRSLSFVALGILAF